MSRKKIKFDGNSVLQSENHNLRTSIENLRLRDDCQREEQIGGSHQVSLKR